MEICFKYSGSMRILSTVLIISILFSLTACSYTSPQWPSQPVVTEEILEDSIVWDEELEDTYLTEDVISEYIIEEIYLEEIIVAEEKISELLISEDSISEVLLCKTIYVPQNNLEEFSANSQTTCLFGNGIDISSLLTKIAVGTGVIVTIVVLKMAGFPQPVASVVAAAANESLQFASSGAAVGSLFGGLTGATDEIDESGRASAVIGFATATAGLVLTIISLVAALPSAGSTTLTAAAGVKLVIAGVSVLAATAGTSYAGYQAVKTFTSTDSTKIDWKNINWRRVGVSAAEKAIRNSADGYMWGAIIGTVHGGAEGFDYYQKFSTPYTSYRDRINGTPKNGERGTWSGKRGESDFVLNEPIILSDGTKVYRVTYRNGIPDFSPFQIAQVKIPEMTKDRYGVGKNFNQADIALAEYWTKITYAGRKWTPRDVETFRNNNNLTWHEMSNMQSMQLVPYDVNDTFDHYGGVAECKAMIGIKEETGFD